nr:phospholipase-like protein [Tanacetum cinerariifolium]
MVVEVDKDLSHDDFMKAQKQKAKINRLAEQRRLRLKLRLKEENSMKSIDFSKSTHMKLALEKCGSTKRSTLNFRYDTCGILDNLFKTGQCQKTYDIEIHSWYVKMRRCLESKLLVLLEQTSMFVRKGIDPTSYGIKLSHAQNDPKQGGVFGDCGVFVCLFL